MKKIQVFSIARDSLGEVETYLMLVKDLGYMSEDSSDELDTQRKTVSRLLRGLYKSLS